MRLKIFAKMKMTNNKVFTHKNTCLKSYRILTENVDSEKLKGYVIWVSILPFGSLRKAVWQQNANLLLRNYVKDQALLLYRKQF